MITHSRENEKHIFRKFPHRSRTVVTKGRKKIDLKYYVINIQCNPLYTTKHKSNKSFQRATCFYMACTFVQCNLKFQSKNEEAINTWYDF